MSSPIVDHDELAAWAKTIAAIGGVVGAIWAVVRRVMRRAARRRHVQAIERRAIRYLLDAQRQTLHFVTPGGDHRMMVEVEGMLRQKALVDEVRDQLWEADGHKSARDREQLAEDVGKWLTRTQAIRLKEQNEAAGLGPSPRAVAVGQGPEGREP